MRILKNKVAINTGGASIKERCCCNSYGTASWFLATGSSQFVKVKTEVIDGRLST